MTARDQMLSSVRRALGRSPGDFVSQAPAVRLAGPPAGDPVVKFSEALTALGGKVIVAESIDQARTLLEALITGKRFVASRAPILGPILGAPRVEFSREACAAADIGVTSADFALADTGTLVFLSKTGESRLISLLPPCHVAVIERAKILTSLDELLAIVPKPGLQSSAMVLITGPSRTADIEMRLVRGVHGPGEIVVIIVDVSGECNAI